MASREGKIVELKIDYDNAVMSLFVYCNGFNDIIASIPNRATAKELLNVEISPVLEVSWKKAFLWNKFL